MRVFALLALSALSLPAVASEVAPTPEAAPPEAVGAEADGRLRLTAEEVRLKRRVAPTLDEAAREELALLGGAVKCVAELSVSARGRVTEVTANCAGPALTAAAVDAIGRWRYAPHEVDGEAVPFVSEVRLSFQTSRRVHTTRAAGTRGPSRPGATSVPPSGGRDAGPFRGR